MYLFNAIYLLKSTYSAVDWILSVPCPLQHGSMAAEGIQGPESPLRERGGERGQRAACFTVGLLLSQGQNCDDSVFVQRRLLFWTLCFIDI